jgi:hypothetical protein
MEYNSDVNEQTVTIYKNNTEQNKPHTKEFLLHNYIKIKKKDRAGWGCSSVVESFPSKHKTLGLISSTSGSNCGRESWMEGRRDGWKEGGRKEERTDKPNKQMSGYPEKGVTRKALKEVLGVCW